MLIVCVCGGGKSFSEGYAKKFAVNKQRAKTKRLVIFFPLCAKNKEKLDVLLHLLGITGGSLFCCWWRGKEKRGKKKTSSLTVCRRLWEYFLQ